jgi:hypothetical protein
VPRALRVRRLAVPAAERAAYLAGLPARREALRVRDCNFWVYEDGAAPGSFIEFVEARDNVILMGAGDAATAREPILAEVSF